MPIQSRARFTDLEGNVVEGGILFDDKDDNAERKHALTDERDDELVNEGYLSSIAGGSYSGAIQHEIAQTSKPGRDDKYV